MSSAVQRASDLLRRSSYTVALTGAGISTPSGIPDFRSPQDGLWATSDPLQVASLWAFAEHPDRFYAWFRPLLGALIEARPNPAHAILAHMEARRRLQAVLTQNIDSLHQLAGSRHVVELHGHTRSATCLSCGYQVPGQLVWPGVMANDVPPLCPHCGGPIKPDAILFGEPLPYELVQEAQQEALRCEVMLVIGTSLEVMPAADLPLLARRRGARTILINRTATELDDQFDLVIQADVVGTLRAIWECVEPR